MSGIIQALILSHRNVKMNKNTFKHMMLPVSWSTVSVSPEDTQNATDFFLGLHFEYRLDEGEKLPSAKDIIVTLDISTAKIMIENLQTWLTYIESGTYTPFGMVNH
jgi:hypothetical protein